MHYINTPQIKFIIDIRRIEKSIFYFIVTNFNKGLKMH